MKNRSLCLSSFFLLGSAALLLSAGIAVMGGTAMAQEADVPHGQVAPLNPDFLQWHEDYLRGTYHPWSASGHPLGAAPSPLDLSHLKGQGGVSEPRSYPSSYDLRTYGKMTGVRDQDGCGVCWAFASLGSMESTLETAETRDFSENNMKNKNGFDGDCCSTGGAYYKPMAYLARWDGLSNPHLTTLPEITAATGQESHGISAAPAFVAPATADFTLGPSSPLIDHGVYIPGINDGYYGQAPDLGAVESL